MKMTLKCTRTWGGNTSIITSSSHSVLSMSSTVTYQHLLSFTNCLTKKMWWDIGIKRFLLTTENCVLVGGWDHALSMVLNLEIKPLTEFLYMYINSVISFPLIWHQSEGFNCLSRSFHIRKSAAANFAIVFLLHTMKSISLKVSENNVKEEIVLN